jgi:hypothetical protein
MGEPLIRISLAEQRLELRDGDRLLCGYEVSTARNGPGEQMGSECTPRGAHTIRAKIGAGLPEGAVLEARRPTGEVCSDELLAAEPERDWILTRILWLSGLESGRNRSGQVDSMRRFIYIHGCPDAFPLGVPASHGCVRMRNRDVIELFDWVEVGTQVLIEE